MVDCWKGTMSVGPFPPTWYDLCGWGGCCARPRGYSILLQVQRPHHGARYHKSWRGRPYCIPMRDICKMPRCIRYSGEGGLGALCCSIGRGHLAIYELPTPSCLPWRDAQLATTLSWCPIAADGLIEQGRLALLPPAPYTHFVHCGDGYCRLPPLGAAHGTRS